FFPNWEYGGTARTLGSTSTRNIGRERFSNGLDMPCVIIDVDRIELSRPTLFGASCRLNVGPAEVSPSNLLRLTITASVRYDLRTEEYEEYEFVGAREVGGSRGALRIDH